MEDVAVFYFLGEDMEEDGAEDGTIKAYDVVYMHAYFFMFHF